MASWRLVDWYLSLWSQLTVLHQKSLKAISHPKWLDLTQGGWLSCQKKFLNKIYIVQKNQLYLLSFDLQISSQRLRFASAWAPTGEAPILFLHHWRYRSAPGADAQIIFRYWWGNDLGWVIPIAAPSRASGKYTFFSFIRTKLIRTLRLRFTQQRKKNYLKKNF